MKILEEKLAHLIALFNEKRVENDALKKELDAVKQETVVLKQNMVAASDRIETLMRSLP